MSGRLPVLIVGGGPAGATAAIQLARGGARPLLIERSNGPRDVVCGAFLGWDALASLRRLGLDPAGLGARPIHRLRLVTARRTVETALPKPAAGLSRRRLDESLLELAESAGVAIRRGVAARAANAQNEVRLDSGETLTADALFLATGKHELRGLARAVPARRGEGAVGLRASFPPSPAAAARLAGVIELHPFDGGYAGLLLQEDGSANLCMSVSAERLRAAGGLPSLLGELGREAPRLGDRLAETADAAWLSISNVPYGWRARSTAPGLFRLGDQAAVIASLAGDGVAIALASGLAAAEAHLAGECAPACQRNFARSAARPVRVAQSLRWAAERPAARRLMLGLAATAPRLTGWAAQLTRIEGSVPAFSDR